MHEKSFENCWENWSDAQKTLPFLCEKSHPVRWWCWYNHACIRAGGNGTAGTAMAVPVFEEEKMASLLTYACVIEWPLRAACRSLGRLRGLLRTFSSHQASKVTRRELRLLNYMYSDTWVRGERTNWGGANMRVMRGGYIWQLGCSIASLATETTGRWFGTNVASEAISECLIWKIFLGVHAPRPP